MRQVGRSIGNKIQVPTKESEWTVKGNNVLSDNSPVILQWNNKEGVTFEKKIELDDKYLFQISQQVKNNSNSSIDLYPYAQMTETKSLTIYKIFTFNMKVLSAYLMMN